MKNLTFITEERIEFCQTWLEQNIAPDYLMQQDVEQFEKQREEFTKSLEDWMVLKCFITGEYTPQKHAINTSILKTLEVTIFKLKNYFYINDVVFHDTHPKSAFTFKELLHHANRKEWIDLAVDEAKQKWSSYLV